LSDNETDLMRRKVEVAARIGAELSRCNKLLVAAFEATTAEALDTVAAQVDQGERAPAAARIHTVREVAELLGVSIETVRRAIRAGTLRAWSPPGEGASPRAQRISHDDLLAYWRAGGGGDKWTL
jgi:excisionase family DNA binding protein